MGKVSYIDFLKNPKYMACPFDGIVGWALANRLPTVEDLQEMYDFTYYSSMNAAVTDVNNGTIGTNADATKATAVAGVYTDQGRPYVVLLKDTTEATRIQPSVDMTINLGGHTLSANDSFCILNKANNLIIDGKLSGSAIRMASSTNACTIGVLSGKCSVEGGTYTSESNGAQSVCMSVNTAAELLADGITLQGVNTTSGTTNGVSIVGTGKFTLSNSKMDISVESFGGLAGGVTGAGMMALYNCELSVSAVGSNNASKPATVITNGSGGLATISNCRMKVAIGDGKANGVYNDGTATISGCNIFAYSNYYANDNGYSAYSQGVTNYGTLTLDDCHVMGTHSGMDNHGVLYVNGGEFESYGHGGIYFSGEGTTAYVRNATLKDMLTMPDGYEATSSHNGAAFYIGGGADANNIKVYMDNCDLYGSNNQGVLRGSSSEKNNSLYISNSRLHKLGSGDTTKLRLDGGNHTIYIGAGNSFTEANVEFTTGEYAEQYPSHVVVTDEVYTQ